MHVEYGHFLSSMIVGIAICETKTIPKQDRAENAQSLFCMEEKEIQC